MKRVIVILLLAISCVVFLQLEAYAQEGDGIVSPEEEERFQQTIDEYEKAAVQFELAKAALKAANATNDSEKIAKAQKKYDEALKNLEEAEVNLEFAQGPYDSILGNSYIDTESEVILIPVSGSDYDWEWDPRTGWKKKKRPEGQKPLPPGWFWMLSPFGYIPVEWYIEVPIGKAKDVQPVPQEPEKKQKSWFERVFGKPAKPPPAAPQEPKIAIDEKVKPSDTVTTPEGIAIEHKPSVYELHKQKLNTE